MAAVLQRPPRENVTPVVLGKIVWAGANLGSYQQATEALRELGGLPLTAKQTGRITSQIGIDDVRWREALVEEYRQLPLMERLTAPLSAEPPEVAVVMMDGGRYQRRDHFQPRRDAKPLAGQVPQLTGEPQLDATASDSTDSHWREDKVGIVLSMTSEVHDRDPTPEFPEWLAHASVVSELAHLAARDEEAHEKTDSAEESEPAPPSEASGDWPELAPKLVSREVIASSTDAESFGWHLAWKAWTMGVPEASRQAFVADGLAVNWSIHRQHFSHMTGILDLMHALSYAWRASAALGGSEIYRRYARWIWQGQVALVIDELRQHQERLGLPDPQAGTTDPRQRIARALTYYENHAHLMDYPAYRQQGLPLTSSHIESTVKLISARIKGTEKFWRKDHAEGVLQLRADSLSYSQPLSTFWNYWRDNRTGANNYRPRALA